MKVELITVTPNCEEVIEKACRVCYDSNLNEATREKFLASVIKRGHESVIEHASATFKVSGVSRALTHQLVRHRVASYSQRSQRYVKEKMFDYVVPPTIGRNEGATAAYQKMMDNIQHTYNELITFGVPAEDARFVLPNACHTEIVITMNFREFRHFILLRADSHAQWEIRNLAGRILLELNAIAPSVFGDLMLTFFQKEALQSMTAKS